MRIIVAGGSGRLGSRVASEALACGHAVTILSRSPEAIDLEHPKLERRAVDVRDKTALSAAIEGQDAVISTLGYRRASEAPDVLSVGMRHIVDAMQAAGIQRLITLASAGILQLDGSRLRCERPGYPEAFRAGANAHLDVWKRLQESSLDWTLVCPPELVEGERAAPLSARIDYLPEGPLRVSMEALAGWMLANLARSEFSRKRVGILSTDG